MAINSYPISAGSNDNSVDSVEVLVSKERDPSGVLEAHRAIEETVAQTVDPVKNLPGSLIGEQVKKQYIAEVKAAAQTGEPQTVTADSDVIKSFMKNWALTPNGLSKTVGIEVQVAEQRLDIKDFPWITPTLTAAEIKAIQDVTPILTMADTQAGQIGLRNELPPEDPFHARTAEIQAQPNFNGTPDEENQGRANVPHAIIITADLKTARKETLPMEPAKAAAIPDNPRFIPLPADAAKRNLPADHKIKIPVGAIPPAGYTTPSSYELTDANEQVTATDEAQIAEGRGGFGTSNTMEVQGVALPPGTYYIYDLASGLNDLSSQIAQSFIGVSYSKSVLGTTMRPNDSTIKWTQNTASKLAESVIESFNKAPQSWWKDLAAGNDKPIGEIVPSTFTAPPNWQQDAMPGRPTPVMSSYYEPLDPLKSRMPGESCSSLVWRSIQIAWALNELEHRYDFSQFRKTDAEVDAELQSQLDQFTHDGEAPVAGAGPKGPLWEATMDSLAPTEEDKAMFAAQGITDLKAQTIAKMRHSIVRSRSIPPEKITEIHNLIQSENFFPKGLQAEAEGVSPREMEHRLRTVNLTRTIYADGEKKTVSQPLAKFKGILKVTPEDALYKEPTYAAPSSIEKAQGILRGMRLN